MIVVADTTPLNHLILIGHAELLPQLFGRVIIPPAVFRELQHARTPEPVRQWLAQCPPWLSVVKLEAEPNAELGYLGDGERQAIALAEEWHANYVLLDEIKARKEAARRNVPVMGTLGVLRQAARMKLLPLPEVLERLQRTTFQVSPDLLSRLLEEDAEWRRSEGF